MLIALRTARGKLVERTEPLFWNYLFVLAAQHWDDWRAINGTRGVAKLISNGIEGVPAEVPEREIITLKRREASGELRQQRPRRIRSGDSVQFRFGALIGQIGIVHRTRRERIEVLLAFLGSVNSVTAPRDWLRLVPDHPGCATCTVSAVATE